MTISFKEVCVEERFILKMFEFVFCAIGLLLLFQYSIHLCTYNELYNLAEIAVGGYLIIIGVLILADIKASSNDFMEKAFMIIGCTLNLLVGTLMFVEIDNRTSESQCNTRSAMTFAISTTACGVLMVVDIIILFKR